MVQFISRNPEHIANVSYRHEVVTRSYIRIRTYTCVSMVTHISNIPMMDSVAHCFTEPHSLVATQQ